MDKDEERWVINMGKKLLSFWEDQKVLSQLQAQLVLPVSHLHQTLRIKAF